MKFAIIPWAEEFLENRMFDPDNDETKNNRLIMPYICMRREFEKNGDELNTIDVYRDLNEVDYFLFFELSPKWMLHLIKKGFAHKMIYCNAEPETVKQINSRAGYEILKKYFPYIMTWNEALVDDVRIFKRIIPYYFEKKQGKIPYGEKKLLTNVSGNKKSDHPDELYSERERLITYFETNYPSQFDLYGTGWDQRVHSSYKGTIKDKFELYHHYKFAICLENIKNVRGYITEKIFDCLVAGIVPIYQGADDICRYVPQECFVDYKKFQSMGELADFLVGMSENEYEKYQLMIDGFLNSDIVEKLDGSVYAQNIYHVIQRSTQNHFQVKPGDRCKLEFYVFKEKTIRLLKEPYIKIKNRLKTGE